MRRYVFQAVTLGVLLIQVQLSSAQSDMTVETLDKLVERGQLAEANFELYKINKLSPELMQWLVQKAESGMPPFQYEYSRRLLPTDPDLAVRWYARAYIVRSLDFVECTDRARNPIHMLIGTAYQPVLNEVLKDKPRYASELNTALTWESERKIKPDSKWLCDAWQIPADKRAEARSAHIAEVKQDIIRLERSEK